MAMASAEEDEGCFTLIWEIENVGLFLSAEEGRLECPVWKVEITEGAKWCWLFAYHSGSRTKFVLAQLKECLPFDRCEMSLISSCGEVPLERDLGLTFFIERGAIHDENRESILPNGTLTLCCKMWRGTMKTGASRIHSVLHSVNYHWDIERLFSSHVYDTYIEKDNFLLYVTLKATSRKGTYEVVVGEVPSVENWISFVDCTLSIDAGRGRVITTTYFFPFFNWKCDLEISSKSNEGINMQLQTIIALHNNVSEAVSGSSGALSDDLLLLYRERTLSDATLNSEGKSFSAHRSILAARSPVFRAMFEKDDMNEGRSGVVDIEDVDSETVDRMLVFLYGDSLEGVQWEEAVDLYCAADKYAVLPLMQKCSDILKAGLTADNACDALVLADTHPNEKLMILVVNFIRDHQEVFSTSEWEKLEESNPRLTTKIFREVYVKKEKK